MSQLPSWLGLLAVCTIFMVMLSIGLLLGREQFTAALQRRVVLAAIVFAVVVPVPVLAVLAAKLVGLRGPMAVGIVLMSISPGAPVALRRAIDIGGHMTFAPALHLAILLVAVVTVPLSVLILNAIFDVAFMAPPLTIARQVFVAQLLPLGVGAATRAWRPGVAARWQPPLARLSNALLLAFAGSCIVVLWPMFVAIGWTATLFGVVLTAAALGVGGLFAWRDAPVRPLAAMAVAMRNPGLALLIATINRVPPIVTAVVFEYALGAAVVIVAFVMWQGRARRRATRDATTA